MKIGDKVPIVLEVVRPMEERELVKDVDGKEVELCNFRGHYFWAAPGGNKHGPFMLVCADSENEESEAHLAKRRAIVELIECGVC